MTLPAKHYVSAGLHIAGQLAAAQPLQVRLTRQMLAANALSNDAEQIMRTESRAFVEMLKSLKQDKPL